MITCQVKQRVKTWPYLRACVNEAEFVTRPSVRANLDEMVEYVCAFHASSLQDAFGESTVLEMEKVDDN